ncbi:MAG: single-stranded DNA-binding protein [Firmicutes bacterium]|nr:single-stranded DNA-binding protein [Bacillota bacterium]
MNKVILIGRLTKDPEMRYSTKGDSLAIARYTLAVNRRFKREGSPDADFIQCVSFGKQAEFVEKYFKKGSQMACVGRLDVSTMDDQTTGKRTWFTSVIVEEVNFTESRAANEARSSAQNDYYDSIAEQYTPPASSAPPVGNFNEAPDGFAEIKDAVDDDGDLPF